MTPTETIAAANDEVVVECELPAAPAKVWRALTIGDYVARWLLPNSLDVAGPGDRFTLDGSGHGLGGRIDCEVIAAETERRLAYSWREGGEASVVVFELSPSGAGTLLRVTHGAPLPVEAANHNAPLLLAA